MGPPHGASEGDRVGREGYSRSGAGSNKFNEEAVNSRHGLMGWRHASHGSRGGDRDSERGNEDAGERGENSGKSKLRFSRKSGGAWLGGMFMELGDMSMGRTDSPRLPPQGKREEDEEEESWLVVSEVVLRGWGCSLSAPCSGR